MLAPYQPSEKLNPFPTLYEIALIHMLAVIGLFLYPPTWQFFFLMVIVAVFVQGLGITLVYHRCLTHRAFDFKFKWAERIFTTLGALGFQRGPLWWCSIHRIHHRCSDTFHDPHNSRQGFWYPHVVWMLHTDPRWKSLPKFERYEEYIKDIASDPYYRWLDRYDYIPYLILLFILYVAGGWAWIFWGGFISTVYSWHITWCVNSVSHKFGYRSFNTNDTSTNNWLIGLLALGEGWHNNHHAFPSSPKQGFFKWWEFDFTYLVILLLQKLGLVHHLRYASEKQIKRAREASTVRPSLTVEDEARPE